MTFKEIQELIKLVNKSDLGEVKIKQKDFEISLRNKEYSKSQVVTSAPVQSIMATPAPAPAPVAPKEAPKVEAPKAEAAGNYLEVKSPIVGTFYRSASPDKPPFVKVGDTIEVGSVVCIVEAMKLFNEIESEIAGTIVKVLIDDASPVEYDQVLYLVEPA